MTVVQPIAEVAVVRERLRPHSLFLLIAPLLYFAYALLTPPFQTPDEHQHLFRAWQLSQLQLIGERRGDASGGVLPASLGQAALPEVGSLEPHALNRPIVRRSPAEFLRHATPVRTGTQTSYYDFRGAVIYSPAGYLPQVAAIWFGEAVDLSVENIVRLGRLLNASLAIFLIYWALRLTPVGALPILFTGLLPMTAAASAAFGQDGLVIGGACLLTATGLRVALGRRRNSRDLLVIGAVAILLTLAKLFYLPLALIGGQPVSERRIDVRRIWPTFAICIAGIAVAALWLHANAAAVVPPWPAIPPAGQRLASWFHDPLEFPRLLERTYIDGGPDLLNSLFELGWVNVPAGSAAAFSTLIALGLICVTGDPKAADLRWPTRLWLIGLALTMPLTLALVAWLYWTPAGMSWIPGLQGRYFIPILPTLLIAMLPARKNATDFARFVPLLMVGANVVALASIVRAFYIV